MDNTYQIVWCHTDNAVPWLFSFVLQAMVHELIGIKDNKVDLRSIGKFPKDQEVDLPFSPATNILNYSILH